MSVSYSVKIEVYLNSAWVDISTDLVDGADLRYGIEGAGPTDCVAGTGVLKFQLRNSAECSGGVVGYYSPSHASVRSGWKTGVLCRLNITYLGVDYPRFYGKVIEINPIPGSTGRRTVDVVAYDFMRDLAEADVREVDLAVDKTEAELLTSIIAAVPSTARPLATSFDSGVDTYAWAFDNLASGVKALALAKDVVVSAVGVLFMKGNGTLRYVNRHNRNISTSSGNFVDTDGTIFELEVPSTLQNVYNRVRATIHPKDPTASPVAVLTEQIGYVTVAVDVIVEAWAPFTDEANRDRPIGGYSVITPLVAGTDYSANSSPDGSGTDLTSFLAITTDIYASTVKFTMTNVGTQTLYVTMLKVRGQGVYDDAPSTFEASSAQDYGDRPLDLNLVYQDDPGVGQNTATYIEATYNSLLNRVETLGFMASFSDALMQHTLNREPNDKLSITESVTGVTLSKVFIQSIELEFRPGGIMFCRFGLAPGGAYSFWQLGIVNASELGQTTIPGF